MARYRKIEVAVWNDERFCELSAPQPNAQTLWLYLLSGPRTTSFPGLVVARAEVMASDLGWSVEAFREAFGEASAKGLLRADWKAGLVVLSKALIDSSGEPRDSAKPESPNVLKSWSKSWDEIPECALKTEYLLTLESFAKGLGEAYLVAFREGYRKALAKVRPNPSPNQDQDQDQDQTPAVLQPRPRSKAKTDPRAAELAELAISEINRLARRSYKADNQDTLKNCRRLAKEKRSDEDVLLVIRSKAGWIRNPEMRQNFRPSTLLRPGNFDRYFDEAQSNRPQQRQAQVPPMSDEPDLSYQASPTTT